MFSLYLDLWKQGWILASAKRINELLNCSGKVQDRILDGLKKKGFIETARFGIPSRRFIKINVLAINRCLDELDVDWELAENELAKNEYDWERRVTEQFIKEAEDSSLPQTGIDTF